MDGPAWVFYTFGAAWVLAGLVITVGAITSDWSRWPAANRMGIGFGLLFIFVGVRGYL